MGGRPSQESWRWPRCRGQCPGFIGVILKLRIVVQVSRLCVDGVEGAADVLICTIVAIKAADEEEVDNPQEASALAEGAVKAKAMWAACAGWGVEGDGLTVSKPHQEVGGMVQAWVGQKRLKCYILRRFSNRS